MITAVDSSVLMDVFLADPVFGPASQRALRACLLEGRVIACEVVWAEVCALADGPSRVQEALTRLTIEFEPMTHEAASAAGALWRAWRESGGKRDRIVADFMIGAHAREQADRLVTRDRGFYRKWFEGLEIFDPSGGD